MTIHIEPERGVPTRKAPDMKDLAIKTSAAAKTVEYLHANGLEVEANNEDKDIAAALAVSYAENNKIQYNLASPKPRKQRPKSYADNFRFDKIT